MPKGPGRTEFSTDPPVSTKSVRCTDFTPAPFFTTEFAFLVGLFGPNSLRPRGFPKPIFTTGPPLFSLRPPFAIGMDVACILVCCVSVGGCCVFACDHAHAPQKNLFLGVLGASPEQSCAPMPAHPWANVTVFPLKHVSNLSQTQKCRTILEILHAHACFFLFLENWRILLKFPAGTCPPCIQLMLLSLLRACMSGHLQ